MKQVSKIFGLIFLIIIYSCAENLDYDLMDLEAEDIVASASPQISDEKIERKLIKEGQLEFETSDLVATRKTIFEVAEKYQAYISSDREFRSLGRESNTVVIRVPANSFDNLLREATKGVEKFELKQITVKDITEEFLDIEARLKTKKELESRYLDLLKQAKNVLEILEIEKQIGLLRAEIESIEGRLKYLQNKVSFATLTMTFYESVPQQSAFGQKFKNGFRNGWENLIWFFVFFTNIWPFILIGLGLIFGIRLYRKRN